MKKWIVYFLLVFLSLVIGWELKTLISVKTPGEIVQQISKPLEKYTIVNLAQRPSKPSQLQKGDPLQKQRGDTGFTPYLFSFTTDGKKVTGELNIPDGTGPFPVVILIRGYVDKEIYQTGVGTRKAASEFAKAKFITLAPDFLGYGGSDKDADSIFEARFQTYTTVLDLLASVSSLPNWDKKNVFIWAHSNGGQIALASLEISQKEIPTSLWAPVSKPFPYSILAYSDEASDSGKFLRKKVAQFEDIYDSDLYSIDKYFDHIKAPIQIEQGTADQEVPYWWTQALAKKFKDLNIQTKVFYYPGADHNLTPGWNLAISRDISFFKSHLSP